jgi:hypothetical protein
MRPDNSDNEEADRFLSALSYAFDILGPVSLHRLYDSLKVKYDIDVRKLTESDLPAIKHAISDIFGDDVAQLLMKQIYAALDG